MPRTELHASWLDGETFRALWAPLDASDEFLLISCYASGPALEALESTLRVHLKRPSFRCTLVFSQNIARGTDADEQVIFETLTEAWTSFVSWYGFTPGRADWGRNIPAWTSRGTQDDEDPPSVPRATELASFDA